MRKLLVLLEMIKIQHSLFALPFAVAAALAATDGHMRWAAFGWIVACMVTARASAMAFNRWADAAIDARNPRTAGRAIPKGEVSKAGALVLAVVAAAAFVGCAAMLNRMTLWLSPLALVVVLGYSFTKRFTALCHFVLGLSLAIAPIGAWIAIRGTFALFPLLLGLGVLLWTAGFDILYACMDAEFDRAQRLHSVPAAIGIPRALRMSAVLHALTVVAFVLPIPLCGFGWPYGIAVGAIALLLAWEHRLVSPHDLGRVNRAFFHVNVLVSVAIMVGVLAEVLLTPAIGSFR